MFKGLPIRICLIKSQFEIHPYMVMLQFPKYCKEKFIQFLERHHILIKKKNRCKERKVVTWSSFKWHWSNDLHSLPKAVHTRSTKKNEALKPQRHWNGWGDIFHRSSRIELKQTETVATSARNTFISDFVPTCSHYLFCNLNQYKCVWTKLQIVHARS